jgi:hypothetical protein
MTTKSLVNGAARNDLELVEGDCFRHNRLLTVAASSRHASGEAAMTAERIKRVAL